MYGLSVTNNKKNENFCCDFLQNEAKASKSLKNFFFSLSFNLRIPRLLKKRENLFIFAVCLILMEKHCIDIFHRIFGDTYTNTSVAFLRIAIHYACSMSRRGKTKRMEPREKGHAQRCRYTRHV